MIEWLKKYEWTAFTYGLPIRVFLILVTVPLIYSNWFVPFLSFETSTSSLQFWNAFLAQGGDVRAFPYGPLYLVIFRPFVLLGGFFGGSKGAVIGLGLAALMIDYLLYFFIRNLLAQNQKFWSVYVYWLSPIILYCTYWHGQLDVLPVMVLAISLYFLKQNKFFTSAIFLGLSISTKFVMVTALPFFILYLLSDTRLHTHLKRSIVGLSLPIILHIPLLLNTGFQKMVLKTPETNKIFSLEFSYSDTLSVYILPVALLLLMFACWRVKRINTQGILGFTGLAFFVLFLLTPSSAGWAIWVVPFIAFQVSYGGKNSFFISLTFSIFVVLLHLYISTGAQVFHTVDFTHPLKFTLAENSKIPSLLASVTVLSGFLLCYQIIRYNITNSDFHDVTRNPILVSIAGDSGTGKDTLSDSIEDLFGKKGSVIVSGDDYHNWDRKKPMWRALTHLNPLANDLEAFESDVLTLTKRKSIRRRHYDHSTGRMTKPLIFEPKDVIISSGLHALLPTDLCAASDLKVFLNMDEDLRRKLKINRDVNVRGHALETVMSNIESRMDDAEKYIYPQAQNSDLLLKLKERKNLSKATDYTIIAAFHPKISTLKLEDTLIALGGLATKSSRNLNDYVELEISGYVDRFITRVAKWSKRAISTLCNHKLRTNFI